MSDVIKSSPEAISETKKEISAVKKSMGLTGAGKGSAPRKVNLARYRDNWDAIFGRVDSGAKS